MPITYVTGDPLLTDAPVLAFGHNARGRTELGACETALMQQYPAAFAVYQRRCKQNKQRAGTCWLWTQAQPQLLFLTIRETAVGATRLRFVQAALLALARDYRLYGISGLAIAPLGSAYEQPDILPLVGLALAASALPVTVYTAYQPGSAAVISR